MPAINNFAYYFTDDFTLAIPDDDSHFVEALQCPQEYKLTSGQSVFYWDDNEAFLGWPSIRVTWDNSPKANTELIRQAYATAITGAGFTTFSYGRAFVRLFNNEAGEFQTFSCIWELPTQDEITGGDISRNFSVNCTKLNLHQTGVDGGTDAFSLVEGGDYAGYGSAGNYYNNGWQL